jgi:hypothetical protein
LESRRWQGAGKTWYDASLRARNEVAAELGRDPMLYCVVAVRREGAEQNDKKPRRRYFSLSRHAE